ncbi:hypothetical protein Droror1_Dr00012220 [Drosera rotundifolia]
MVSSSSLAATGFNTTGHHRVPVHRHNHHRAPFHRPHRLPPHLPSPTTVLTFLHVERRAARGSSGNTRIKPSNKVSPSSDKGMMSGNGEFIALGLALRR